MITGILRIFAMICTAIACGKLISKIKLPAILGWLIAGIVFGPHLAEVVTLDITDSLWYQVFIKPVECFAGVMIGREIILKKIASSGKQIVIITVVQSMSTFLFVSLVFSIACWFSGIPIYLSVLFGGIALATAPAPVLSIVNEYHTDGPVTKTLIPLAAIDDIIGIIVFFTVISIVKAVNSGAEVSVLPILGMVLLPFVIGIATGLCGAFLMKKTANGTLRFLLLLFFLCLSTALGLLIDWKIYHSFCLNYLLIGMTFSMIVANMLTGEQAMELWKRYTLLLNLSFVIVIVNLGMPLDYRFIAGAGLFTALYILSRAVGKIGGAYVGGTIAKAEPTVKKYLGFTLLPHSGVSLVFTGIAVATLTVIDTSLAAIVSGTIVAAAIINEIIAVIVAKFAFQWAHEIKE